jgi:multiple sugar transport system substrate-binding protein
MITKLTLHVVIIVSISGFLPMLTGCNQSSDITEIRFWVIGAEGEYIERFLPEFEQEHPEIRVRIQKIPWTAAHEKLLTAYASNSMPDVYQLGNTWIPEFVMLDALENLTDRIAVSEAIQPEDYFPGIWKTNIIEEGIYGIPWYVDTRVLFYRKDLLERAGYAEPPKTWDELYDAARNLKALYENRAGYAILLPTNEWAPQVVLGLTAGSSLLREEGRYGNFSGDEFVQAFDFYARFFAEGLAPVGITQVTNIYQGITEGFFAMYISGPWNVGEFRRRLPPEMQDKWMTAPLPGLNDRVPGVSLAGGASLVLSNTSKNKDAAWKFIEFYSRPETQTHFTTLSGNLPPRYSAWERSDIKDDPHIHPFYEQLQHVEPLPKVPEWEQIAMKVQQYGEIVSTGRMSPLQTAQALDKDVDRILEKRRWILERRE